MRARRCKAFQFLRRLAADRDGAVAIEFAFAGTITLALIFSAIDIGRLFIINGLLGDAARQISRENQVRLTAYTSAEFNAAAAVVLAGRASGMLDPNLVTIQTQVFDSFSDLAANTQSGGAPPGGNPGQIVKYRVSYDMDYITPFVDFLMDGANFAHVAEIIVYNEPETTL